MLHGGLYSARLIPLDLFLPIDHSRIASWPDLDPVVMKKMQKYDPGNRFVVPYMWGTVGLSYNLEMIRERMPDAPLDSADMVFNPDVVSKFADCGVTILESPTEVIPMALLYLGLDQDSADPSDLARASALFKQIRPYVKYFSSTRGLIDLPNQEVCIVMNWSGDYAVARARAEEAGIEVDLAYESPQGGFLPVVRRLPDSQGRTPPKTTLIASSTMCCGPRSSRGSAIETGYANAVVGSHPFLESEVAGDPAIYPTPEIMEPPGDDPEPASEGGAPSHAGLGPIQGKSIDRGARPTPTPLPRTTRRGTDPEATPFVRIEGLTKRFGDFTAVDAVDLSIYRGELFAILGRLGMRKVDAPARAGGSRNAQRRAAS